MIDTGTVKAVIMAARIDPIKIKIIKNTRTAAIINE